jgi:tetratricopeptide (TPR) repeat protein
MRERPAMASPVDSHQQALGGRAAVRHTPADALLTLKRPDAAIAHYTKALALTPNDAEAHNNLGLALQALGRLEEAATHYEKALAIKPTLAVAHCNLGSVLRIRGYPEAAVAHYEQALVIAPDDEEVHCNLGNALQTLGRCQEAMAHYTRALALKPDFAKVHNNLGNLLQRSGSPKQAIVHYQRALAITPSYAAAHCNLGSALLSLNHSADAIVHYDKALAIDRTCAEAHHGVGIALQALGELEKALAAFERAVQLAPRRTDFHLALAQSKRFTAGDPRLAAMEILAADMTALGADQQIALHFALGKAYGDLTQHQRAFRHLATGNALKRRRITYNERQSLSRFEDIRSTFTLELIRAYRGVGDPSAVPLFVVGMPRSGTTLIEQILSSHSRVFGAGEISDFRECIANVDTNDAVIAIPQTTLSASALRRLASRYLDGIRAAAPTAQRIVDKMPANFALVGLIHLAFPHARIIHARRDPIDTCLSCFSILFVGEQPYAYDLGELGRYYRSYQALMDHWRTVLPPDILLEVRYEDVIDDLEGQARRILAHCGLSWEETCLDFQRTRRSVRTASCVQVRQPIYRDSVGRWRPYANELKPLFQALGVPSEPTP